MNQLTSDGVMTAPVVFGTSCLGNLYRELPFETKLAIAGEWFKHVEHPTIDSAGKYGAGLALECIGKALRTLEIPEDRITISNKLGWRRKPLTTPEPTFEPGAWANLEYDAQQDISYNGILRCYEEGRQLLGDGYHFSLLSVHDPDEFLAAGGSKADILSAYKALFELKAAGETKAVGIGSKDWKVIRDLYGTVKFDWVMLACAPTILVHPPELIAFMRKLRDEGVGIINSAVFNGGFLTGSDLFDYRKADPVKDAMLFEKRAIFFEICKKYAIAPAAAAVEYGMCQPGVVATALNTSNPARIAENVELVSHHSPAAFLEELALRGVIA